MIGKDLYKIEANIELSNERLKSLIFFYAPLLGHDAMYLYQYLVLKGSTICFDELNNLLTSLNISVDLFEKQCSKLNEYKLLKTLTKENKYVFVFVAPLTIKQFISNDVFVRDFILKTSGSHYQELIADVYDENLYIDYEDISSKLPLDLLNDWSSEDESYLKKKSEDNYDFGTLFDVNYFLKDVSTVLFPMRFRTSDNLKAIATYADLYNISYDKMRSFLPRISSLESDQLDLNQLKYLCMNARSEYQKVDGDKYDVPCKLFLMSLQDGKEVTLYDMKIIDNLSNKYYLNTSVINVLLKHCLEKCDNKLVERYIYAIAADLHRNNINTAKDALNRLNKPYNKSVKEILPTYDSSKNDNMSDELEEELLELMGKK